MSNDPTTTAATYFASEISIEERDAALAEAAELSLADYHAHLDSLEAERLPDDSDWNYYPEDDYNEYTMGYEGGF